MERKGHFTLQKANVGSRDLSAAKFDRDRLGIVADGLVAAAVASSPTSATGIFLLLWFVALFPTLDDSAPRDASYSRSRAALPWRYGSWAASA
jgi:hypothetical protein